MKEMAIKNRRDNLLVKYEDRGISAIPFIMEIEDGDEYSMEMIKKIYQRTTGHEMSPILYTKYFK
jgi:hypothetical protein